ncbi:transcriptional regulator, TetR family [Paenibacillus uliginis N3/975]|uniref:Transcriptional regulator, TetR family n=1 Tax=Paenibacillus uliginis N3/975 TaxID=1313296 RepID=A0A1X7H844_9BACL|nr:TetR/AcrR family transcriptional regulator [Paenibacillus uliginis]SMF81028.1 transcriptional regulator, TetR family [Paenibacillus uliginis N3/975]
MRKGEKTRLHIIRKSAELFNQKGVSGSSIQDIIETTGVTKGGIYRSFSGKDEIALEAFAYAGELVWRHFNQAIERVPTAAGKILAFCNVYNDPVHNPPLKGGCPFLISAVESDHSTPVLRELTVASFDRMLAFIREILQMGVECGEFRSDLDTESVASFIFSAMQGEIMISRLTKENKHALYTIRHIEQLLMAYSTKKSDNEA